MEAADGAQMNEEWTGDPFVTAHWLLEHLYDRGVVVLDCRFSLQAPDKGLQDYLTGHVPGARYADLDRDLSSPRGEHGGRHPLPAPESFALFASRACIGATTHVVAYDEGGEMAARCWWLFRYFGHDRVSVLEGGIGAWREAGLSMTTVIPESCAETAGTFAPRPRLELLAGREDVLSLVRGEREAHLVDARAPERYRGEVEPLDPKAGHIPGARNYFWQAALAAPATWKVRDQLGTYFAPICDGREVILYCGSGVTAAANALALAAIGVRARVYAGSWSDWCSYGDSPVATGEEGWADADG